MKIFLSITAFLTLAISGHAEPDAPVVMSSISFEASSLQTKEALSSRWNKIEAGKRKNIEAFLTMDLGLSATGGIRLIGVYQYQNPNKSQESRTVYHFQQIDTIDSRLFWSVLVDPETCTARLLYHINQESVPGKFVPIARAKSSH